MSERALGVLRLANRRRLTALLVVIAASVSLRLLTWNPIADGGHGRYVNTALVGGAAAAAVWWLVRVQADAASRLPLMAAAAVLLSGDAVHYVRLANPISWGGPVQAFVASFTDEAAARRQWDFEASGMGAIVFERGAVGLDSPSNATAYMRARLSSLPDVRVNWWLPVGLAERERSEHLIWRASVIRAGDFYVVTQIRHLLVQIVSYGVHVTYPDERKVARGYEIPHRVASDGQVHEWQLSRDSQQIALSIDGERVWATPQREELRQIQLGETKADPQHGGSMRVEAVSYASVLDRR